MKRIVSIIITLVLLITLTVSIAEGSSFNSVQKGSKGQTVKDVQTRLIELGFLTGNADGVFGKGTEKAVLEFQLSQGLRKNGIVDEKTYNALNAPATENAVMRIERKDTIENPQYKLISAENLNFLDLNKQNSVQNEGSFLISNGWIYGQSWDSNGNSQFVKVRTDFTDWTVLDKGYASHIYIVDNYIYYMLNGAENGLYRMRTSGENRELIAKAYGSLQIVDNYIYYTDFMINGEINQLSGDDSCYHLYRCDLEGENTVEIINKPTFHAFVFEDGILYQDDRDNMSLHICDLNGNNDTKLNDNFSFWPIYDGEYIYYVCAESYEENATRTIWRTKPDGTDQQQVAPYPVSNNMLLTREYIYFVNADDGDRLYRINKDGSNMTLITQDKNIAMVEFFDSSIKYTKYANSYEYIEANYFCDYDGSGKRAFEK